MKKKILVCGHTSLHKTGFGIYNNELIRRLNEVDEFEVAEMALYGTIEDKNKVAWKYYPNAVNQSDSRYQEYISSRENIDGAWRFNNILLHFKPDIVCCCLDPNMFKYQAFSPLRKYFNWSISTTLDGWPQKPEYIDLYHEADNLYTYTDWAKQVLDAEYDFGKEVGVIPLGVSTEYYYPLNNKKELRKKLGFQDTDFIVGSVMRNQNRKLIGDLIEAFSIFVNNYNGDKTPKLIFNTTYPDELEWDIPNLLNRYGCYKNIYFPYLKDGHVKYFNFNGINFNGYSFKVSDSNITQPDMAEYYNILDVYVQYAKAEGFGIPMFEALACGVDVVAPQYAAMEDFNLKFNTHTNIIPIKYFEKDRLLYRDCGYPNNVVLANILLNKIEGGIIDRCEDAKSVRLNYSWDECAKKWIKNLKETQLKNKQGLWFSTKNKTESHKFEKISELNNADFIRYLYKNFSINPDKTYSFEALNLLNCLDKGFIKVSPTKCMAISRDSLYNGFFNNLQKCNKLDKVRLSKQELQGDYLYD